MFRALRSRQKWGKKSVNHCVLWAFVDYRRLWGSFPSSLGRTWISSLRRRYQSSTSSHTLPTEAMKAYCHDSASKKTFSFLFSLRGIFPNSSSWAFRQLSCRSNSFSQIISFSFSSFFFCMFYDVIEREKKKFFLVISYHFSLICGIYVRRTKRLATWEERRGALKPRFEIWTGKWANGAREMWEKWQKTIL